jgi:5-formyltetrahydrofolate cyclo-ligase
MVHASSAAAKTVMRLALRGRRRSLAKETPDAAERAADHLPSALLTSRPIVGGYRAQGAEMDPWPLMTAFAKAGARLALPVALHVDAPLVFRAYAPGDALAPDAFNIPAPTEAAAPVEPDLIIAPLVAFDRAGGRMGQGGGHYDRTLEALRAKRDVFVLGLAYAGQEVACIPREPQDQPLDAILTEKAYIEAAKDL